MNIKPIINIGIRGLTMVSRFILIFVIAKLLPNSDMGLYGLLTTTIVFSLYVVGLDFYIHSTRELIKTDRSLWGRFFKSQITLSSVLYIIYLPCITLIFYYNLLPWSICTYLIVILVLEHLCQELQRILIADQKPLQANLGLFIRTGLWPLVVVPMLYFDVIHRNLSIVLYAWIIGDLLAFVYFIYMLHTMRIKGWRLSVDWAWIWQGVKICSFFLIGTLTLRFGNVAERFWLQNISTLEIVGVYSFYVGISSVLSSFIDAGVIAFKYPRLIKAFTEKNMALFQKEKKEMTTQLICWLLILTTFSFSLIHYVLSFVGKEIYFEFLPIFYVTLSTAFFSCLSLLPHYELYARAKDKIIVLSHILSLPVFLVSGYALLDVSNVYAIPLAALVSQGFIFFYKLIALDRIHKNECTDFN